MKKRRGQMAIDSTVSFLIICALLVLGLSALVVVNQISTLNTIANELSRFIEIRGSTSGAEAELSRLCESTGIQVEMAIEGDVKSGKIQQGAVFTVVLESNATMGVGGLFKIPIPIIAKSTGRGEKLWK